MVLNIALSVDSPSAANAVGSQMVVSSLKLYNIGDQPIPPTPTPSPLPPSSPASGLPVYAIVLIVIAVIVVIALVVLIPLKLTGKL